MPEIVIMGLGPGALGQLPLENYQLLKAGTHIFFRTEQHPLVADLRQAGISFESFDHIYNQAQSFEQVYNEIADRLIAQANLGQVLYAVPGHPLVAEDSVRILKEKAQAKGIQVRILPAMSFLDVLFSSLNLDPIKGFKLMDALEAGSYPDPAVANLVTQVYSPLIASDLKLKLMDYYPEDYLITVIKAAGHPELEKSQEVPLFELDRLDWVDYLTSVYVPPFAGYQAPMDKLESILAQLRSPQGCPWDREQTHQSLKAYLLEETYEVVETIDDGDMYKLCEELGDLLLQIVFHAQIAKENEYFGINDVIMEITEKLIRRHPHVFGDVKVSNSREVNLTWEAVKRKERDAQGIVQESVLEGIPKSMPALLKAERMQHKAAKVGFDWDDYQGALAKVHEEIEEVEEAIGQHQQDQVEAELGDLLFAVVNLCRFFNVNPEAALARTNRKFMERFKFIENTLREEQLTWEDVDLAYLDKIWEKSKVK